ncbi:MAG: O-antigen ligase family protein [Vicinamibacterales bacterium]
MSLTLAAWLIMFACGLMLSFANPVFGLLAYLLEYYLRPSLNWWGQSLPDLRWTFMAALVMAVTFALRRSSLTPMAPARNLGLPFAVLMCLNVLLVTQWAVNPDLSWVWGSTFLKHMAVYALIIGIIRSRVAFEWFVTTNMMGIAWWGYNAIGAKRSAGRLESVGSGDSLGSNLLGAHLLTILPFVLLYALSDRNKWRRGLAVITLPLLVNLIVLANSRGAMMGVAAAFLAALPLAGKRQRLPLLAGAICLAGAFYLLADKQFIERQQTTQTAAEKDNSAMERIKSWQGAMGLVRDYPLGGGGRAFHLLSPIYIPDIVEGHGGQGRSVHNTLLQVAAEWGLQGLTLYLGFLGSTFIMLRQVRKRAPPKEWMAYRAICVQLGLIGTFVAGLFGDRFYGESVYWLCALSFALVRIQATELAGAEVRTEAAPRPDPLKHQVTHRASWRPEPTIARRLPSTR